MMSVFSVGRAALSRSNTYQQATAHNMPVWFEAAVLWGTIASYSATNLGCTTRRIITVDPLDRTETIQPWIPSQSADSGCVVRQAQMAARNAATRDCAKVSPLRVAGRHYVAELSPGHAASPPKSGSNEDKWCAVFVRSTRLAASVPLRVK